MAIINRANKKARNFHFFEKKILEKNRVSKFFNKNLRAGKMRVKFQSKTSLKNLKDF